MPPKRQGAVKHTATEEVDELRHKNKKTKVEGGSGDEAATRRRSDRISKAVVTKKAAPKAKGKAKGKAKAKAEEPSGESSEGEESKEQSESGSEKSAELAPKSSAKSAPRKPGMPPPKEASESAGSEDNDDEEEEENDAPPPKAKAKGKAKAARQAEVALDTGDMAPTLTSTDENGNSVTLSEVWKTTGAVLFFYPKANTPGCTKQASGFKDKFLEFESSGFSVYGVSNDNEKAQLAWHGKLELPYHLLCDTKRDLIKGFGFSKAPASTLRSHVVVAMGGKILDIRKSVTPEGSVEKALEVALKNPQV